jgi:hypothetical protein
MKNTREETGKETGDDRANKGKKRREVGNQGTKNNDNPTTRTKS